MTDKKNVKQIVTVLVAAKLLAVFLLAYSIPYAQGYISVNPDVLDEYDHMYFKLEDENNILFRTLCCRWDSQHYLQIAVSGYHEDMLYAFSPLYPLLIRITSIWFLDPGLAAIVISNIFAIISAIIFYKTARLYLKDTESYHATLFFSLFPTVFVYGTVAYTEPVFLTFSIAAWYLFEKKRYFRSGLSLTLAALTRYAGVMLFPLFTIFLLYKSKEKIRDAINLNTGLVVFLGLLWTILSDLKIPYSSLQKTYWGTQFIGPLAFINYIRITTNSLVKDPLIYFILFIALGVLCYRIKPRLSFYVLSVALFYSSFVGTAAASLGRFLGTLWPAYLPLGKYVKNKVILITILAYCWIFSVVVLTLHALWIFYA